MFADVLKGSMHVVKEPATRAKPLLTLPDGKTLYDKSWTTTLRSNICLQPSKPKTYMSSHLPPWILGQYSGTFAAAVDVSAFVHAHKFRDSSIPQFLFSIE